MIHRYQNIIRMRACVRADGRHRGRACLLAFRGVVTTDCERFSWFLASLCRSWVDLSPITQRVFPEICDQSARGAWGAMCDNTQLNVQRPGSTRSVCDGDRGY